MFEEELELAYAIVINGVEAREKKETTLQNALNLGSSWVLNFLLHSYKLFHRLTYQIIDGEYQVKQSRGADSADSIESPTFPELKLTAQQVFAKGN